MNDYTENILYNDRYGTNWDKPDADEIAIKVKYGKAQVKDYSCTKCWENMEATLMSAMGMGVCKKCRGDK